MNRLATLLGRLHRDTQGAVLAETIVVVPFVTLFSVGILEFGNMFWQKEQIETGLRDAARYLSRCQPTNKAAGFESYCTEGLARRLAYYGTVADGTTAPRVTGWTPSRSEINFDYPMRNGQKVVVARTDHVYSASPLFNWLRLDRITIQAYHEQRYVGW
ncbi:pilus assembly protein [Pseudaminobacter sp. 19-2017]|uniref:Pilus assembly protein n=2 Tax=Pseudaminobacter soli (ex Zhang et al. 2022) TaxID=2831468 RepID=A0A942DZ80_9HYPH|nr:pilus assembly protein [Pseudaminobacter soli]